jgi:uncharacterized protein YoxC
MLSALDILYIILSIGVALMTIFFSVVLIYAILILRDVNKASDAVKQSAERVNKMIVAPLKMTGEIMKMARPVVEVATKKVHDRMKQEEKPKAKAKKKGKK